jgi:hypothetical protein
MPAPTITCTHPAYTPDNLKQSIPRCSTVPPDPNAYGLAGCGGLDGAVARYLALPYQAPGMTHCALERDAQARGDIASIIKEGKLCR